MTSIQTWWNPAYSRPLAPPPRPTSHLSRRLASNGKRVPQPAGVTKAQIVDALGKNCTTAFDLQSLTGLSRSAVSRALRDMHAEGAIKKIGEMRNVKGGPSIAKWGLV